MHFYKDPSSKQSHFLNYHSNHNAIHKINSFPSPDLLIVFKNCFGIIISVSTFIIGSGATIPVIFSNLSNYKSSTKLSVPFIADAAAIAGLTK